MLHDDSSRFGVNLRIAITWRAPSRYEESNSTHLLRLWNFDAFHVGLAPKSAKADCLLAKVLNPICDGVA